MADADMAVGVEEAAVGTGPALTGAVCAAAGVYATNSAAAAVPRAKLMVRIMVSSPFPERALHP